MEMHTATYLQFLISCYTGEPLGTITVYLWEYMNIRFPPEDFTYSEIDLFLSESSSSFDDCRTGILITIQGTRWQMKRYRTLPSFQKESHVPVCHFSPPQSQPLQWPPPCGKFCTWTSLKCNKAPRDIAYHFTQRHSEADFYGSMCQ